MNTQQTKIESIIEQVFNVGSGFIISYLFWKFVLIDLLQSGTLNIENSFIITAGFTVISVIRGYYWRRFFNAGLHKVVHNFVKRYIYVN